MLRSLRIHLGNDNSDDSMIPQSFALLSISLEPITNFGLLLDLYLFVGNPCLTLDILLCLFKFQLLLFSLVFELWPMDKSCGVVSSCCYLKKYEYYFENGLLDLG